jgi:hypothetical protein
MQAATRKIDASGDGEIDAGDDVKVVWRLQRESGCRLCGTMSRRLGGEIDDTSSLEDDRRQDR